MDDRSTETRGILLSNAAFGSTGKHRPKKDNEQRKMVLHDHPLSLLLNVMPLFFVINSDHHRETKSSAKAALFAA